MNIENTERLLLVGDNDAGIKTPEDLARAARSLLFSTQKKAADYLHITPSSVSRYESGRQTVEVGYLAFLVYAVYRLSGCEENNEPGSAATHESEIYRRQLLRLTNRVIANSYNYDAMSRFRDWQDLKEKAAVYEGEKRRNSEVAKEHPDEAVEELSADVPGIQVLPVDLPVTSEPQARAGITGITTQNTLKGAAIAQEQAENAGSAGELKVRGNKSRHARLKKSAAIAVSTLAVIAIFGWLGFFSANNQGEAGSASAKPLASSSPTSPHMAQPGAGSENGVTVATYTPGAGNRAYALGTVQVERTATLPLYNFKGKGDTLPGIQPAGTTSPTQMAQAPPYTSTPFYAPTITPSLTPTKVPVPTRTSTVSATLRTGAVCYDGTVSCSTGSGTCSGHEGVSRWIYYPEYPPSCP